MAKKSIKTDASARSAKPDPSRQVEYPVYGIPGLALRISPKGSKKWTLRYRTRLGEQRRISIGPYPILSLATARSEAVKRLGEAATGGDPAKELRLAKAQATARKLLTVSHLIENYLIDAAKGRHRSNAKPKRTSTIDMDRYHFDRFIRPRFGNLPIADLSRSDVQRFLDDLGEKTPATARQCRNVLRQAYNYGVRREIAIKNPAQMADLPAEHSRERVLNDDEVQLIWNTTLNPRTTPGLHLSPGMSLAIRLAFVTLQRGGEVSGLHARELDFDAGIWTIPGERTKNHLTHVVPLSGLAVEIIGGAFALSGGDSGFAFPSPRNHRQPVTRRAFTRSMKRLCVTTGIDDATPHDFRRTGTTNLTGERIGVSRFIVSRILNHADGGGAAAVTAVYDRNEYLVDKRKALDAWAALLAEIVSGKGRVHNVVSFIR